MVRLILPWSEAHVPGIAVRAAGRDAHPSDAVVAVAPDRVAELAAAFLAYCGSWQQSDRRACALVAPLLARHGVTPLPL